MDITWSQLAGVGGRKAGHRGPGLQGSCPFPGEPWGPLSCMWLAVTLPWMRLSLPWDAESQEEGGRAGSFLIWLISVHKSCLLVGRVELTSVGATGGLREGHRMPFLIIVSRRGWAPILRGGGGQAVGTEPAPAAQSAHRLCRDCPPGLRPGLRSLQCPRAAAAGRAGRERPSSEGRSDYEHSLSGIL